MFAGAHLNCFNELFEGAHLSQIYRSKGHICVKSLNVWGAYFQSHPQMSKEKHLRI